jgi:thiazole synthase
MDDPFLIAGRHFRSRLLVGSGKYANLELAKAATVASGADIITVALRRIDLNSADGTKLQEMIPPSDYTYLPNSAGCYTAEEAVRTLRLARELGGWDLIKLEVIGDKVTLMPDVEQTLRAAEILVKDGFNVMAYTTDDYNAALELERIGCVAVMPLAAPIGSGLGIQNPAAIQRIIDGCRVPVLVDAGIGTASDAAIAMEMGCAGVLLNSAIAEARDPVMMARAFKHAVEAGRLAYRAGRMPARGKADASSPSAGLIQTPNH